MEPYIPGAAAFQHRLSRLYNDTKKSSDFVDLNKRDPAWKLADQDPDIKALHRKLRIQKDRLVTWGLEWTDPAAAATTTAHEIDDSVARAGLSEIVSSVMTTIKDILAETEQLWICFRRSRARAEPTLDVKGPQGTSRSPATDVKTAGLVKWDKGRFDDLVKDLTTSIDTLYDLSRARSATTGRSPFKSRGQLAEEQQQRPSFGPSRLQTPQQIDPASLSVIHEVCLENTQAQPGAGAGAGAGPLRQVISMNRAAYREPCQGGRMPSSPLLLEYAPFDSIFATTGIMPPMEKFEKLSAALQQESSSPDSWSGLPRLLGYFEDFENDRLGLVYLFPPAFNAVSYEHMTQTTAYGLHSLKHVLSRRNFEPPLEAKFRLAYNLANTFFDLQSRGITHGNLLDTNVSFGNITSTMEPGMLEAEIDIRRPMISSFELFDVTKTAPGSNLYRHALDPRTAPSSPLASSLSDTRILDLYSLAMILLQVGLWTSLDHLVPDASTTSSIPETILEQLAIRCGGLYMKAVKVCWNAVDEELQGKTKGDHLLYSVQSKVARYLETCCILDGVTGLEERLGHDLSSEPLAPEASPPPVGRAGSSSKSSEHQETGPRLRWPAKGWPKPHSEPALSSSPTGAALLEGNTRRGLAGNVRTRLYPQVPLPPDAIDMWNSIVMPRVNTALRSFYRKNPESVEISLESIGPSAQQTVPTVLVVCDSVAKVRAILKSKLADLFDGTTSDMALKVCSGSMVRSRGSTDSRSVVGSSRDTHDAATPPRAGQDDDEIVPVNPGFQKVPKNGASIGAWIGYKHLPPVSFGGLVMVDGKAYGMTVHHMLDDPEAMHTPPLDPTMRSSTWQVSHHMSQIPPEAADQGDDDDDDDDDNESTSDDADSYACELSDWGSDYECSGTDLTSDFDSDEEETEHDEPGDIPGVEPGCGDGYVVTQPALDDVEEGFYPVDETAGEDHLDTFGIGDVYASSGIRRRRQDGLVHEIDWALFEFTDHSRLPETNTVPNPRQSRGKKSKNNGQQARTELNLTSISPMSALPGLMVQCVGRTSGLQTGLIMPALTSVKMYGRTSPSHAYQVASTTHSPRTSPSNNSKRLALGLPGDSGAWIVGQETGAVCGHVLAWSQRKQVAYMCPMDVLLQDIADTLCAREVHI